MRAYWRATPRIAKAAFVLGALALAQFVGLWLTYLSNPEPGSNPLPGVVLWGTVTGIMFLAVVTMIALGLRSSAEATVLVAAIGAFVMAIGGVATLIGVVRAPAWDQAPASMYVVGGAGAILGIAYAAIGVLALGKARRGGRQTPKPGLPGTA